MVDDSLFLVEYTWALGNLVDYPFVWLNIILKTLPIFVTSKRLRYGYR